MPKARQAARPRDADLFVALCVRALRAAIKAEQTGLIVDCESASEACRVAAKAMKDDKLISASRMYSAMAEHYGDWHT